MLQGKTALVTGSVRGIGETTARALAEQGCNEWGRIVSMSSVLGLSGRSGRVDYITTKTALLGLTRAVAAETLQYPNITCNAICPGSVLTPFIRQRIQGIADERGVTWDEMAVEYRRDLGIHTDFIEPQRISATIVYLCSDVGKDINGLGLPIDGGLSNTWSESPPR